MDEAKPVVKENRLLNVLAVIALAATVVVVSVSLLIYFKPEHSINPFPPATLPAAVVLWTATPDAQAVTLISTPEYALSGNQAASSPTFSPTQTFTHAPALSQLTSSAVLAMQITAVNRTATPDYTSLYRYQIQAEPAAISASLFDSTRGNCDWTGVAGQVIDLQGSPVTGILVLLGGSLEGMVQNQTTITGTARNYGQSGYEFTLADHLVESRETVWIQLVDQSYIPLSAKVYFDTHEECGESLVIINFKEVR